MSKCLGFCAIHNILEGTSGIEPEACESYFPAIVRCMAGKISIFLWTAIANIIVVLGVILRCHFELCLSLLSRLCPKFSLGAELEIKTVEFPRVIMKAHWNHIYPVRTLMTGHYTYACRYAQPRAVLREGACAGPLPGPLSGRLHYSGGQYQEALFLHCLHGGHAHVHLGRCRWVAKENANIKNLMRYSFLKNVV